MKNSVRETHVTLLKSGLIVDFNNLYFTIQDKFGARQLRLEEYIKHLEGLGHILIHKVAYSPQKPERAIGFIDLLKATGFEVYFGRPHFGVHMALKAADIALNVDCLVVGSNTPDAEMILSWAKTRGKITKCFACNIPSYFKQFAQCIEIAEAQLNAVSNVPK